MRIVVWNMRRATSRSPAWNYLFELSPDLALLQEVGSAPAFIREHFQCAERKAAGKSGKTQTFSTCVFVRGKLGQKIVLSHKLPWVTKELERFDGNLVGHTADLEAGSRLNVISAYSPAWPVAGDHLSGVDDSPIKLKNNPKLWVTELLWAAMHNQNLNAKEPWAIAGDLNCSETFDFTFSSGNREILERMEALGFTKCLRRANGGLVPTFRNPRGGKVAHQMDHLFVSHPLIKKLIRCVVGDPEIVFSGSMSDHLPIIADFKS